MLAANSMYVDARGCEVTSMASDVQHIKSTPYQRYILQQSLTPRTSHHFLDLDPLHSDGM